MQDVIDKLAKLDNDFAQSLVNQFKKRGSLSEKQWFYARKLTTSRTEMFNFPEINALFELASLHLKYPKVHLQTADSRSVVLARAGDRSKAPGTINVTDGKRYGENRWYGRIQLDGSFSCDDEPVIDVLKEFAANPAKVAARYGKLVGRCCFCELLLTDERSTSVGYGPICAEHYGLAWG